MGSRRGGSGMSSTLEISVGVAGTAVGDAVEAGRANAVGIGSSDWAVGDGAGAAGVGVAVDITMGVFSVGDGLPAASPVRAATTRVPSPSVGVPVSADELHAATSTKNAPTSPGKSRLPTFN